MVYANFHASDCLKTTGHELENNLNNTQAEFLLFSSN